MMQSNTVVCFCYGITLGEVQAMIAAHQPESLMDLLPLTKAGNGCGSCWGELEHLLATGPTGSGP